jgi:hypothetical protein
VDAADASRLASRAAQRTAPLQGFVAGGRLTNQHPDLLTFWLPRWSFLGESIGAGRIPLWNPFEMAGYRFAADPQSGWLYAPPMLLFSALSPGTALRWFIVLNPLVAGLGMYAFLRMESLGRAAATIGGLVLAMTMSTSTIVISLPFAGSIAWTTVLLVSASGYRRSGRWSGRLVWLALGAFAWTQVAAAHMSHGLVIATAFVAVYLFVGVIADLRSGSAGGWSARRRALGRVALFLVALPLAALPILVPHIDFIGESSLRGGYGALGDAGQSEIGDPLGSDGIWAAWPLGFASAPGAYAGAVGLSCALLAARARRLRPLVVAVGGLALAAYVLMSPYLVGAGWFRSLMLAIPFGDVYLHNPGRLRYVAVLAIPVLASAGMQGLLERPLGPRAAIAWLGVAAFAFLLWPIAAGGSVVRFGFFVVVLLLAAPMLYSFATHRRRWASAPAIVGILTLELLASAVYAQAYEGGTVFTGLETGEHPALVPQVLRYPELSEAAYLEVTPIVEHIRAHPGRFATWAPPAAFYEKGYLWMKSPFDWPALAPSRGSLFGVPDALGYNPVQLPRYWRYIRTTNELSVFYNASVLNVPSPEDVRLLGLRYLVVPSGVEAPLDGRVVEEADGYSLWELDDAQPLATMTHRVEFVDGLQATMDAITRPGFDPSEQVVIEPHLEVFTCVGECVPNAAAPTTSLAASVVTIRLSPASEGILTVRDAYDPGWRATADGRPVETLPVDGFLQGVMLPSATGEVVLTYHDDAVMFGLSLGAGIWSVLLAAPFLAFAIERRTTRRPADAA